MLFQLCGLGKKKCQIPSGKPSAERLALLRREVLELALYTFRYTNADNVVAIMPLAFKKNGKPKTKQDLAVFLQRDDVAEQIRRPLTTTLTATPPQVETILKSPDIGSVRSITTPRSFNFRVLPGGSDGPYLVLQQLA